MRCWLRSVWPDISRNESSRITTIEREISDTLKNYQFAILGRFRSSSFERLMPRQDFDYLKLFKRKTPPIGHRHRGVHLAYISRGFVTPSRTLPPLAAVNTLQYRWHPIHFVYIWPEEHNCNRQSLSQKLCCRGDFSRTNDTPSMGISQMSASTPLLSMRVLVQ